MKNTMRYLFKIRCFFYGLLLPLSFAPFHIPGFAIISLALFYQVLNTPRPKMRWSHVFAHGMAYGLGFFGLGASWVYVSIHDYGHLNLLLSGLITLLFILYLSIFPAIMALVYVYLRVRAYSLLSILAFPALWTLSEVLRASVFTGFPWLLVGFGQFDAPSKTLLPLIGVYGVSFLTALAGTLLTVFFNESRSKNSEEKQRQVEEISNRAHHLFPKRILILLPLLFLILAPQWISTSIPEDKTARSISVGVIQANLSMRDKWDEQLFWTLLEQYQRHIHQLLGTELIVLPESAIPVSATYISDILAQLSQEAKSAQSSILLGVPKPTEFDETRYYNAMIALGFGEGTYLKKHLVPFGEYIPSPFHRINQMLGLPDPNLQAGEPQQELIRIFNRPIATLICYELAYGNLLREQISNAEFIVSISDDGWFGHSIAMVQHQQIAQVRSLQTARYQVLANNDGLSSVIDPKGQIIASLKPFTAGVLHASIKPITMITPWVKWGDKPLLFGIGLIVIICLTLRVRSKISTEQAIAVKPKRRYPYEPV